MVTTKFRHLSRHLSGVLERASICLEIAGNTFARLQKNAAAKLEDVRGRSESDLRRLRASAHDSLIVANEIFARLGSQVSSAARKAAVQMQKAQAAAVGWGRASGNRAQMLGSEAENDLRRLRASCRVAIAATGRKITQLGEQVSCVSRQATRKLLKARDAVLGVARTIADKPRRMREVRLTKENDLRKLLDSSLDAVVVTDSDRRLVAANAKALELFGISEFNLGNFTVDAFLANAKLADFESNDSPPESREVTVNRCKIRRLDGGWRVAECQFVAGIVPRRHLYKFLNVAAYKITPPSFGKGNGRAAALRTDESLSNSAANARVRAKIPRHGVGPAF